MKNLLLESIDYKIEETRWSAWRSFLYPTGAHFKEFGSHGGQLGLLLLPGVLSDMGNKTPSPVFMTMVVPCHIN